MFSEKYTKQPQPNRFSVGNNYAKVTTNRNTGGISDNKSNC